MDKRDLNRMFDALSPAPGREAELLDGLLRDGVRRKRPMKNWKRVVIGAAAAALLVTGAAAATVTGVSQRLLDYLGVGPEDSQTVELLIPGAMAVDITKEDNGAVFHVSQVLRDRTSILVLADFTAPEGTSLWMGERDGEEPFGSSAGFYGGGDHYFMDEAGERIDLGIYGGYSYNWEFLEDDDPADNHVSAIFQVKLPQGGLLDGQAASMRLPVGPLSYATVNQETWGPRGFTLYSGEWSCDVPLPQKDIGWSQQADVFVTQLDGADITLKEVYLLPVDLLVTFDREGGEKLVGDVEPRWCYLLALSENDITLKDKDGNLVPLAPAYLGGGSIGEEALLMFRLSEVTDPARLQGGTVTFNLSCGTVTLPLDDLAPLEP